MRFVKKSAKLPNKMESNLVKAIVGFRSLRLAAESVYRLSYKAVSCFENDDENQSPVISVECGGHEDDDYQLLSIDGSQDSCRPRGCRNKQSDNCLPREETEAKGGPIKKSRLVNSKNEEKKPKNISCTKQKAKLNQIGNKSSQVSPPPSVDVQPKTQTSSCWTHCSIVADSGFVEERTRQKEVEAIEVITKNTKLDASKNEEKKRKNLASPKGKSREKNNCAISSALQRSPSTDVQPETQTSSCSTYFSGGEARTFDRGFDTQLELQFGNASARKANSVQLPATSTPRVSSRIPADNFEPLYYIRLLLDALEDEGLAWEYMSTRWHGTIVKEAVDAFVQLADATCAEKTAQLCRTEAAKSIKKVYERFLKAPYSRAPSSDTQWINHFSILSTLCDSKIICQEFVNFFINHLITPRSTEDLEDPKQIIEGSIEHGQARFLLIRFHIVLRKYTKTVEISGCETNGRGTRSRETRSYLRRRIQSNQRLSQWLIITNKYVAEKSNNFPMLAYIAAINATLLRSLQTPF